MKNLNRFLIAVTTLAAVGTWATQAEARRYTKVVSGREVVVHTNPVPVLLHRMVPPQHGRHVTEREVRKGSVPNPGPVLPQIGK